MNLQLNLQQEAHNDRELFPIGKNKIMGWKKWLREEIGLSESAAGVLIQLHKKFGYLLLRGAREQIRNRNVANYFATESRFTISSSTACFSSGLSLSRLNCFSIW
jgi:hypothetical protein